MVVTNGVIETATGDLLRAGYCDFVTDGSLNVGTETVKTDVPCLPKAKGKNGLTAMHRWTGTEWIEVPQPE